MKSSKFCRLFVALIAVGVCFPPLAPAQMLSGVWYRLNFTATGNTLGTNGITVHPKSLSMPFYMQLLSTNTAPHRYNINVWTDVDAGWTNSLTTGATLIGSNDNFIADFNLHLTGVHTNSVNIFHTVNIATVTNHTTGAVVSSVYRGGGEVYNGLINKEAFYGSCSIIGFKVNPAQLPFAH